MTTITTTSDGNTPLSPEELADLIPNLATKEELNEWERENIHAPNRSVTPAAIAGDVRRVR